MSAAQHRHYYTDSSSSARGIFASAFSWQHQPIPTNDTLDRDGNVFDEKDRLRAFHPVFVIPHEDAVNMRAWFEKVPLDLS